MRFPWSREPIILEPEKPKRAKETVRSVGDKLLIRAMKKQPDSFGLEMAKKEHGTPEAKAGSTSELMHQLRELREFDNEFFGSDSSGGGKRRKGGKGMWSGEGTWLSEILNSQLVVGLGAQLSTFLRRANKSAQEVGNMLPPPGMVSVIDSQGQVAQIPEGNLQLGAGSPVEKPPKAKKKLQTKQAKQEQIEQVVEQAKQIMLPDADEMLAFLDYEPEALVEELRGRYNEDDDLAAYVIGFLPTLTYKKIITLIEPYREHPKYGAIVQELLLDTRREWLEQVLAGVMIAYREIQEAKKE